MAAVGRNEPYRNFRFEVAIEDVASAGFMRCTGLARHTEPIDYREGNEEPTPHKLSGQTTYDPIVLERGFTASGNMDLWGWAEKVHAYGKKASDLDPEYKTTLVIRLKNKKSEVVKTWTVYNAWISDYALSDFDASANEVLMLSVTFQHEGFEEAAVTAG